MTESLSLSLLTALAIGFLGSLHCVGMCGGISGALATAVSPAEAPMVPWQAFSRRLGYQLLYSLGRITSYALAGALAGVLGWLVESPDMACRYCVRFPVSC
jgi:sulfite exporter TauE/SafE